MIHTTGLPLSELVSTAFLSMLIAMMMSVSLKIKSNQILFFEIKNLKESFFPENSKRESHF